MGLIATQKLKGLTKIVRNSFMQRLTIERINFGWKKNL